MYILRRQEVISVAHRLSGNISSSACLRLHGHNEVIEVVLVSDTLDANGMVLDFGEVKKVIRRYDHQDLNEMLKDTGLPPTAEVLAETIFNELDTKLANLASDTDGRRVWVDEVSVEEVPGSKVTYRMEACDKR